ncbi:MAG: thiamine phosphate synthase [Chromatiales bacterium]|jgi:thiamine-phosphate pyrophosphorylase|nr:thiamine phosphate synthase [Chromatiales bacterium]
MMKIAMHGLYAIADTALIEGNELLQRVREALRGGARMVQYRHKSAIDNTRREELRALRELCRAYGAPLLINDDVALAREVDADGVHLGKEDVAIHEARAALGAGKLIGASCYNDLRLAQSAANEGANYVAFGSFYDSSIKPGAVRASPMLLTAARRQLDVPLVAIGGITAKNGALLVAAGADALAVISGLFAQINTEAAARRYARLFENPVEDPAHADEEPQHQEDLT